mmetsp:Transcript_35281/g.116912  ORF Transcript_35281/g.116912 Transcript_35281/m.116912 type:complete len:257 (-) Transcript_35281:153-923(-)
MTSPLLIFALGLTTNRGGLIRAARLAPVASRSRSSRMSEADEKAVGKLEQELSAAVAAEDYSQAAALRDRLAALQMDSEYGALSANSEFYRAFSERDVEGTRHARDGELSCCSSNATTEDESHSQQPTSPSPPLSSRRMRFSSHPDHVCLWCTAAMRRLWLPSESIVCAHPGHEPIVGFDAVISSWRDIFRSAPAGGLEVAASSVRCSTPAANVARVTCIEEVKPGESKLVATNIYERHEDGSWRMSLHHAGPMVG